MQLLQCKREQFRSQIRQQAHQSIFKQKRISQETRKSTFEYFLDFIINPRIITFEHLKEFNACLLYQINNNISENKIREIEYHIDNLLGIFIFQIVNKGYFVQEVMVILINLTYLSDKITEKLILNEYAGNTLLSIIQSEIQFGQEKKTSLELLLNLWGCSLSHKKEQFDVVMAIKELTDQSCESKDNEILKLIAKCYKNLLNGMRDENSLFDFEFILHTIKQILEYSIFNLPILEDSLESYCTFVQIFNYRFITQDQQLIFQLLRSHQIEQVCRLCTFLYFNEPLYFLEILLQPVITFCKQGIQLNQAHNVLNLCSVLFHDSNNQLQVFYDDQDLIKEILKLSEDCQPRKVVEAAVRCIKILIENSNELQIQNLIELDTHIILLQLSKSQCLDDQHLVFVLRSINNLIKAFSIQLFSVEFPYHFHELAQSKNNEIALEANLLLEEFDKEFHNICQ